MGAGNWNGEMEVGLEGPGTRGGYWRTLTSPVPPMGQYLHYLVPGTGARRCTVSGVSDREGRAESLRV